MREHRNEELGIFGFTDKGRRRHFNGRGAGHLLDISIVRGGLWQGTARGLATCSRQGRRNAMSVLNISAQVPHDVKGGGDVGVQHKDDQGDQHNQTQHESQILDLIRNAGAAPEQ